MNRLILDRVKKDQYLTEINLDYIKVNDQPKPRQ